MTRPTLLTLLLAITLQACSTDACEAPSDAQANHAPGALWPRGAVAVCIEADGAPASQDLAFVRAALALEIEAVAAVRFAGWEACPAPGLPFDGVRVAFADEAPRTLGLGTELIGRARGVVLNATFRRWGPDCRTSETARKSCLRGVAVHEFLHVLGFAHEQNRRDTPAACDASVQGQAGTPIGAWDAESVMNYCNDDWNNGGKLSDGDAAALRTLYGALTKESATARPYRPAADTRSAPSCRSPGG